MFRGRPCTSIDSTKKQVLLLNVGSVRSFMHPTIHEYYYFHQVEAIQNNSNVQVHQIWYISLDDASSKKLQEYPIVNLTALQRLQQLYNVAVLETYDAKTMAFPEAFSKNDPYNRKCPGPIKFNLAAASYALAYHLQSAYQIAMMYTEHCNVDWQYLIRTRPDYACTEAITLDLPNTYNSKKMIQYTGNTTMNKPHFVYDSSWGSNVSDLFFAMDREACKKLFPQYLQKFYNVPCYFTPPGT